MGESTEAPPDVRYKIGEICRLADVQPYVLRYWESEFPVLAADRSLPGPRSYSERDLTVVKRVKQLLYDEGYTIAGAKKRLESELREGGLPPTTSPEEPTEPLAAEPPPLPQAAVSARPRRGRVTQPISEEPLIFEDAVLPLPEPAASPAPTERSEPRNARDPGDVRIVRVVAELREIHTLLSREPA